jgi:hypothetical protein
MILIRSSIESAGLSISAAQASMTSPRLCGGMLVAMPTAMPPAPLTNRFGNFAGEPTAPARIVIVGLEVDGVLVDIAENFQRRSSGALRCIDRPRADRHRPSRNSLPSTSGTRMEESCAIRTIAS